jgi:hypothetical protein
MDPIHRTVGIAVLVMRSKVVYLITEMNIPRVSSWLRNRDRCCICKDHPPESLERVLLSSEPPILLRSSFEQHFGLATRP